VPDNRWIEITAQVAPADVDAVAGLFADVSVGGVVMEPVIRSSDDVEFAFEELDEPTLVRAYAPEPFAPGEREHLRRRLMRLPLTEVLPPLRYRSLVPPNWAEEWKRFYDIQHVGEHFVIRPTWIEYAAKPDELVIDLDPGAAFGTGQHETTRLCLAALERWQIPDGTVLDLGCGSGILAIGAARLGATGVLALDIDPNVITVSDENSTANGVNAQVRSLMGSLGDDWPSELGSDIAFADLVVANIASRAVLRLLPAIVAAARLGGVVILSGFLIRDASEIEQAVDGAGLRRLGTTTDGEWACLAARVGATA
jgi:ribosomal protein L11 methyltransferase